MGFPLSSVTVPVIAPVEAKESLEYLRTAASLPPPVALRAIPLRARRTAIIKANQKDALINFLISTPIEDLNSHSNLWVHSGNSSWAASASASSISAVMRARDL